MRRHRDSASTHPRISFPLSLPGLRRTLASENASRLAAMERADKNIDELLANLHGTFHRLRQSGIDEELLDVISGFEALAGPQQQPGRR
jgi:hypothetical protein